MSNNTKHDRGEAAILLNAHGVTLMELLVTISILLVLAVVSMPAMKVMSKRTHELELRQRLREIRMALDQFHQDWAREGEIAKGEYCTKNKSSCLDHTGPTGYPKTMDVLLGIELTNDIAGDKGPGGMSGGMGGMGGMGMGGNGRDGNGGHRDGSRPAGVSVRGQPQVEQRQRAQKYRGEAEGQTLFAARPLRSIDLDPGMGPPVL